MTISVHINSTMRDVNPPIKGFKYDNILMEESAQILEIETFIPLLLQNPQDGFSRLKRWIMIGDHHQLPPVIKNMAFQKYSNMEQSLFTRIVRLGVPTVDLDGQGRSRPSICNLYNWRYKSLGNLPHVCRSREYLAANPGFYYDFQLINVEDFNGIGESEPSPYFYQNLAEAEYIVATYMYMRLLGYPAEKISILTTYNGQKHLIRDVINIRCADNPLIGRPHKVTTVDKYQGQQNDYILLSLVRTKAVGHLRDVRRLVVAMSRARLGLYVFARVSLFRNCFELTPAFSQLMARPLQLYLAPHEKYPTERLVDQQPEGQAQLAEDMPQMAAFVYDFYIHKVQALKTAIYDSQKEWLKPGAHRASAPDRFVPAHPGGDRDTDSEEEEERVREKKQAKPDKFKSVPKETSAAKEASTSKETEDPPNEVDTDEEMGESSAGPSKSRTPPNEVDTDEDMGEISAGPSKSRTPPNKVDIDEDMGKSSAGPSKSRTSPNEVGTDEMGESSAGPSKSRTPPNKVDTDEDMGESSAGPSKSRTPPNKVDTDENMGESSAGPSKSRTPPNEVGTDEEMGESSAGPSKSRTPAEAPEESMEQDDDK